MHTYTSDPDGWYLIAARDGLVAGLAPTVAPPLLISAWQSMHGEMPAAALIDGLMSDGISNMPEFIVVERTGDGGARIVVRGSVEAAVVGASGDSEVLTARGATTWIERVFPGPCSVQLSWGAAPTTASAVELPIGSGIVRSARAVLFSAPDVAGASRSAAPAPAAATEQPVPARVEPPAAVEPPPAAPTESPAASIEPPVGEATLASVTLIEPPVAKAPPTPNPEPAVEVPATGYDHLFGETVMRDVESAAVRSEEEAEEQADVGDRTVMVEDIAELRRRRRAERAGTPVVAAEPQHVLLLSTGGREVLDQPVIIGRAPSAERVSAGRVPRLVSMTTPNQDISRTHAEIALEGGTVVVTDLHSRNGTTITMPGRPPQKLRAGEPTAVIVGTVVDLGDGATITVQAGAS